ncbi:Def N-formylmethionyl-tRNA deformylase [Microbacteriaceae bacterium]
MHQLASEVTVFDQQLEQLVQDLFDTMDKAPGVGLAAPQIGVNLRVFVYSYPDDDDNPRRGVVINPTLTHTSIEAGPADDELESEGCLSFPGERFALKRGENVIVEGVDLENKPVRIEAEGWFARVFQHEFDHLNGIIYVDKLEFESRKEAFEVMEQLGWNKPGVSWLPGTDNLED